MRKAWQFLRAFVDEFQENDLVDLAAQVAYWSTLALFPFLMFLLTVVGYLPLQGIADTLLDTLVKLAPAGVGSVIKQVVHEIVGRQRGWLLAATLAGAVWSASSGISSLIVALNRCYGVRETRPWWKVKSIALLATLATALSIIVVAAGLIIAPEMVRSAGKWLGFGGTFDEVWRWIRWPLALVAMILMLAIVYLLPNRKDRHWRFLTPGAVVAVLMFLAASWLFRVYVSHFPSYAKTYGALATIIVLLTWIYLSCLSVLVGGQVNAIHDRALARRPEREPGGTALPDRLQPA
jgi:membrane protein